MALVAGRPSLPGGRCREDLVAGRPSLPGGPRCREALVAGRPWLPGGPRCREALVAGTTRKVFSRKDLNPRNRGRILPR